MKRRDFFLALALLLLALLLFGLGRRAENALGTDYIVTIGGKEVFRGKLNETGKHEFRQQDGSFNLLVAEDGYVWMKEANCRDGLCVQQGKTNTAAKSIVCLPHKLVVSIVGKSEVDKEELDVIVQ